MNKENILKLAKRIREAEFANNDSPSKAPFGFNMGYVAHSCGTPSCIAGFGYVMRLEDLLGENIDEKTVDIYTDRFREMLGDYTTYEAVISWLDIPFDDGKKMFEPREILSWVQITPDEAATMLENYVATGQVDWSHTAEMKARNVEGGLTDLVKP